MKGFVFDLDGTVYLGDTLIDGAAKTIALLRERGDRVVFLSNKPIATRVSYAEKLTKMGIPTTLNDVLNSSLLVARYLQERVLPGQKVFVIGEEPIRTELLEHEIALTESVDQADYVVLSWDRQFTYDKLNLLYQSVIRGAVIVASNPDTTCPVENGNIPDTGTFIAALESATGKAIDVVVGKPSKYAAKTSVEHLGLTYDDCYMVGDRLETDIRMGNNYGMKSVLVLTGVSTRKMAEVGTDRPAYILDSIRDLIYL